MAIDDSKVGPGVHQKEPGVIVGRCPYCYHPWREGETELKHWPGCACDPELLAKLVSIRQRGARPS